MNRDEYYRRFNREYEVQRKKHEARCTDPEWCVDDAMGTSELIGCNQHIVHATELELDRRAAIRGV